MSNIYVQRIIKIAQSAGAVIMNIYDSECLEAEWKSDGSPLTRADKAANEIIVSGLQKLSPAIPIVSEEEREIPWSQRKNYQKYWLIDPLDGTKEFIERNDEFTVNIALIEGHQAVLGIVYAPAKGLLYYGGKEIGAFKKDASKDATQIRIVDVSPDQNTWRIVGSRSHQTEEFKSFIQQFSNTEVVSMGSSLKLCLVAEGKADLYPRLGPTCEWDTAAAQAVVEAAGGQVIDYKTNKSLKSVSYTHLTLPTIA